MTPEREAELRARIAVTLEYKSRSYVRDAEEYGRAVLELLDELRAREATPGQWVEVDRVVLAELNPNGFIVSAREGDDRPEIAYRESGFEPDPFT